MKSFLCRHPYYSVENRNPRLTAALRSTGSVDSTSCDFGITPLTMITPEYGTGCGEWVDLGTDANLAKASVQRHLGSHFIFFFFFFLFLVQISINFYFFLAGPRSAVGRAPDS